MFIRNERSELLNVPDVYQKALSTLADHGLSIDVLDDIPEGRLGQQPDVIARVDAGSRGDRVYEVAFRSRVSPETATALPRATDHPLLLVASHIGKASADVLTELGIDWVDSAGNIRLEWDNLLIDIRGRSTRPGPNVVVSSRAPRAFSRAGLQVLFVLLSWPELADQPLRAIAKMSRVSLGTAQLVVEDLSSAGYLYESRTGRRLTRTGELLSRWAEAYTITLAPKLALISLHAGKSEWWRSAGADLLEHGVQIGGEAGASLLDAHLRPAGVTLYVESVPDEILARHRLRAAKGDGNVEIRRRFWEEPAHRADLVPTTLIYADLLASGDPRQREQANRLRESDDRLKRLDQS
jgi:Uncharacterized protein conserved in bacteria